jgi:DNA-binding XRE family transcriptional regulator
VQPSRDRVWISSFDDEDILRIKYVHLTAWFSWRPTEHHDQMPQKPILEPNASPGDDQTYLLAVRMRISQARRSLNLTQEAAADLAHLPVRTYQGLESLSEHRDFNPTLKTLRAVARAVGQTVPDLTREPTQTEIEPTSGSRYSSACAPRMNSCT